MAQFKHLPLILDRHISWSDGKNSLLFFSIYYFMMIDDGLAVLVDLLDKLLVSGSIDMPQRRYGEIAEMVLTEPALSPAFSKAKRTVEHWQQIFTTTLKKPANNIEQA